MNIDAQMSIPKPPSVHKHGWGWQMHWMRRCIMREIWDLRMRILNEEGEDIFQIVITEECVNFSLKGEIQTLAKRPRKKRK